MALGNYKLKTKQKKINFSTKPCINYFSDPQFEEEKWNSVATGLVKMFRLFFNYKRFSSRNEERIENYTWKSPKRYWIYSPTFNLLNTVNRLRPGFLTAILAMCQLPLSLHHHWQTAVLWMIIHGSRQVKIGRSHESNPSLFFYGVCPPPEVDLHRHASKKKWLHSNASITRTRTAVFTEFCISESSVRTTVWLAWEDWLSLHGLSLWPLSLIFLLIHLLTEITTMQTFHKYSLNSWECL